MMSFPIEKYRFYVTKNKVVAVSTYGGKNVRGVAKCAPEDAFSVEKGKELAAARCNARVAAKRRARATKEYARAIAELTKAERMADKMRDYSIDAVNADIEARQRIENILKTM